MTKRYSGDLTINVTYNDRKNDYATSVYRDGKKLWDGRVRPAKAGFGPGIAYDSQEAYDQIASTALSFADHEVGGIGDTAAFDENLTGWQISRQVGERPKPINAHARSKKFQGEWHKGPLVSKTAAEVDAVVLKRRLFVDPKTIRVEKVGNRYRVVYQSK